MSVGSSNPSGERRDEGGSSHSHPPHTRDENLIALTQSLERDRDTDHFDPSQDKEVRRKLRQDYRRLIQTTEEHRKDYANANDHGLEDTLNQANFLFTSVKNTQEAALDSKLLVLSANITTQRARNLRLDNHLFNMDEFIAKVKTFCGTERSAHEDWNWKKLGQRAAQFSKRAQSMDLILGPLSVEKKIRKPVKQARLTKNKEDLVQPTKLQQDDVQQQTNETSANVNSIYKILDERGPTNYFEFITNPESFSQSVENMFYVSFLIRNAVAEIDDTSGQPILSTRSHPTMEELVAGLRKKQIIMSLSMPLWEEIIETYGIRQTIIPTREKQADMTEGKWY
ncbi:Nse4 C-terminal-domain-containing protein [Halteromyces radiatus]|uniref:Nse4 C-terminal-domain-containing protein n=1 Tax=Halteromyces radiatus TaxID=101107 RepID=UPI00222071CC|nr:Nse4 C-terminal-domain-containing protein [Halteromyces radiatus]KAI8084656.1 Nse4 C-terminal-domain-containing protein [Halteromyces radiatus]